MRPLGAGSPGRANWLALLLPAALLGGAWGSQLIGGLIPCEMCHWQRWPHYGAVAAALLAWEVPGVTEPGAADDMSRRFESIWTVDPSAVRRASLAAARLSGHADEGYGVKLEAMISEAPMASSDLAQSLTTLTNRMVAYLEEAA